MRKNVSVILTGTSPSDNLEKVLLGYNAQNYRNFEIFLVFSESESKGLEMNSLLLDRLFFPVSILKMNKKSSLFELLSQISTDYVLFASISGIPRYDFVEQHIKYREEGYFLCGKTNFVSKAVTDNISEETLNSGACFKTNWLSRYQKGYMINQKFRFSEGLLGSLLNRIFCNDANFNLSNSSAWRNDLEGIAGNPFSEIEIMKSLSIRGRKPKQLKFSTVLLETERLKHSL